MPDLYGGSRSRGSRSGVWRRAALRLGVGAGVLSVPAWPPLAAQASYTVLPAVAQETTPQPTRAMQARVSLTVQDSTVASAVRALVHQAHLRLLFDNVDPQFRKRINVRLANVSLSDALATVLRGTRLAATLAADGETVVLRVPREESAHEGTRLAGGTVVGWVTDSTTGVGLKGASVHVEGVAKLATMTTDSGQFTLREVPPGDQVLQARLFGYRPATRTVTVVDGERTTVRILMAPVPTVLSGIVTTATGVQRKVEVGNDITTINVDSVMQVAPVTSVTDLLETRVPGLTVLHSSGDPGNPSRLRLRGVSSIAGNNDPITIVDGMRIYASQSDPRNANLAPTAQGASNSIRDRLGSAERQFAAPSPIDQLDPASIETIEVLKGPSASAMYGSDAANGVIIITTKRGRAGPTHWTLNLGQGVNWIPGRWPDNYFRFGTNLSPFVGDPPFCNWYDPTCVKIDSLRTFQALNESRYTVLSHGSDQTASLTVSGGVPAVQYSLSGSGAGTIGNLKLPLAEQQHYETVYGPAPAWMVRPDRYTTWGVNGSLTAAPTPTLRATVQSSVFTGNQQTSSLQGAISQLAGVYISGGYVSNYAGTGAYGFRAPLATTNLVNDYVERVMEASVTTQQNLTLAWQLFPWLPLTTTGGLQGMERTDRAAVPYGVALGGPSCLSNRVDCGRDTTGYYSLGRGTSQTRTLAVGTTVPVLRQHVKLEVGGNYYSSNTNDFTAYTNQLGPGISTPTVFYVPCATDPTLQCSTATQANDNSATYGWYVEPRLNLNSRFFVAPGFRLDGGSGGSHSTSTGGVAGGLSAFPKIDFSYVAVDRQGSRPLGGVLTLLRPRLAFGLAGTQPSPEDRLRLFTAGGGQGVGNIDIGGQGALTSGRCTNDVTTINGVVVPTVCFTSLGNTQLHPERSRELEGGLDATLWNGRLALTYTRYNKTRKDAIIRIPVAPSISAPGGDALYQAQNIGEVRNTGTELTANVAVLESRALSWNVGVNMSNDNNVLVHLNSGQAPNYELGLVPGYPLFGQWVHPIVGFADLNHDKIIEHNEVFIGDSLVFLGQPNPKSQLNLTTDVHLLGGRLGVYGTFAYQSGMTQANLSALQSASFATLGNKLGTALAYQAAYLAATDPSLGQTPYGLIQTVNTFRFNELSINYELPRTVATWFRVPRATVAVQGSNLALQTNYRGKDPNVNAFSTVSSGDETADLGQLPEPRTWWLKLTLGN